VGHALSLYVGASDAMLFLLCVENILTLANAKSSTDSYGNLSHTTMLIFCSFAL
jgi:hypothetical protein